MKKKDESLRISMPNLNRPKNVFEDLIPESNSINDRLLNYKEIKMIYSKTGIQPIYFLVILIVCLIFILIGLLESYLTYLIATLYPLYISIKTIQTNNKDDIKQWLTYWVVYSFFINLESLFGFILHYIMFYSFLKIIFLLILYLPQYNGALWIYDKLLKDVFNKYESHIYEFSVNVVKKITKTEEKKVN
jgi:receptor expression-enhancing protein 5/6